MTRKKLKLGTNSEIKRRIKKLCQLNRQAVKSRSKRYAFLHMLLQVARRYLRTNTGDKVLRKIGYPSTPNLETIVSALLAKLNEINPKRPLNIERRNRYKYLKIIEWADYKEIKAKYFISQVKKAGGFNKCIEEVKKSTPTGKLLRTVPMDKQKTK